MKLCEVTQNRLVDRVDGRTIITVYHGTSTALLDSIRQRGLRAGRAIHHSDACAELSVTTKPEYARMWAAEAVDKFGGAEIVLPIHIPRGRIFVNREMMAATDPPSNVSSGFVRGGYVSPSLIDWEHCL